MLRFWETEFRWLRPEKSSTNQRRYTRKQVERALDIKSLLYERGFTIAGARRQLSGGAERPERGWLDAVKKEVRELLQLVDE